MQNPVKLGLGILAIVIIAAIAWKVLGFFANILWSLIVPVAVVAAIILIVYGLASGKALGGGRGRLP